MYIDIKDNLKMYMCTICSKKYHSQYKLQVHYNKHPAKCLGCALKFKSWREVNNHWIYCSRRTSAINVRNTDVRYPTFQPIILPFKCQLCGRKYKKQRHLFCHQVHRCLKRYRSRAWVVKI